MHEADCVDMAIEISEMDGKIGGFIIRLACGLLGIAGVIGTRRR